MTHKQREREAKRRAYEEASPANVALANGSIHSGRGRGRGGTSGTFGDRSGPTGRGGESEPSRLYISKGASTTGKDNGWIRPTVQPDTAMSQSADHAREGHALDDDEENDNDEEEAARIAAELLARPRASDRPVADGRSGSEQGGADGSRAGTRDKDDITSDDVDDDDDHGAPEAVSARRSGELNAAQETELPETGHPGALHSSDPDGPQPAQTEYIPPAQRPCRDWMSSGHCRFGRHCKYVHDPSARGTQPTQNQRKKVPDPPAPPPVNPYERDDLVGKLLHNEIKHEISDLVQVIDFLARNDWLKGVELYPGHKEEVERRRIKVLKTDGKEEASAANP